MDNVPKIGDIWYFDSVPALPFTRPRTERRRVLILVSKVDENRVYGLTLQATKNLYVPPGKVEFWLSMPVNDSWTALDKVWRKVG